MYVNGGSTKRCTAWLRLLRNNCSARRRSPNSPKFSYDPRSGCWFPSNSCRSKPTTVSDRRWELVTIHTSFASKTYDRDFHPRSENFNRRLEIYWFTVHFFGGVKMLSPLIFRSNPFGFQSIIVLECWCSDVFRGIESHVRTWILKKFWILTFMTDWYSHRALPTTSILMGAIQNPTSIPEQLRWVRASLLCSDGWFCRTKCMTFKIRNSFQNSDLDSK